MEVTVRRKLASPLLTIEVPQKVVTKILTFFQSINLEHNQSVFLMSVTLTRACVHSVAIPTRRPDIHLFPFQTGLQNPELEPCTSQCL